MTSSSTTSRPAGTGPDAGYPSRAKAAQGRALLACGAASSGARESTKGKQHD